MLAIVVLDTQQSVLYRFTSILLSKSHESGTSISKRKLSECLERYISTRIHLKKEFTKIILLY